MTALAGHTTAVVSAAATAVVVRSNALAVPPDNLVAQQLDIATQHPQVVAALADAVGGPVTLDDLVEAFEALVPGEQATAHGAVFTPAPVATFMATEAVRAAAAAGVDLTTATAVDPAVGCGALLVAVLNQLVKATGQPAHKVAQRLWGVDVDSASVQHAKVLISVACLLLQDTVVPDLDATLVCGDALTLNWPTVGPGAFSIVIANPPYVRYQRLDESTRDALAAQYQTCRRGNFNLYYPFFELAAKLAAPDGSALALITPNAFLTTASGAPLRQWLAATRLLSGVVDFGAHKLFEALTYTAISFGSRPSAVQQLRYLPAATVPSPTWVRRAAGVDYDRLGAAPWQLVGRSQRTVMASVERAATTTLGEVAEVRFGVATLRDKLYVLSGQRDRDGHYVAGDQTFSVEAGLTRPCARVSSLPSAAALAADPTRIIYPYQVAKGRAQVLTEAELASRYPLGYAYLCSLRAELARRDNGAKTYAAWYAYGRTQGLVPLGPKLLTPLYAAQPRFLRDSRRNALFLNGCAVTPKANAPAWVTLEALSLLLNSTVCQFFMQATAPAIDGGYHSYQKRHLVPLPLVPLSGQDCTQLTAMDAQSRHAAVAARYGVDATKLTLPS